MSKDDLLKELEEQARLLGMSGEREAKLIAEKEALQRELESFRSQHVNLSQCLERIMRVHQTLKKRIEELEEDGGE